MTVCYGISYMEVEDGFEDGLKPSASIKVNAYVEQEQKPVATNYGFGPMMVALPFVDDNRDNKVAGNCRRVLRDTPKIDKALLQEFSDFVGTYVREKFTPIPPDADVSFNTWIDNTHYSDGRKEELRKVHASLLENCWDNILYLVCKCFQKWEHYTGYKHSRGIMSRTDEAKVMLAPIFKIIENAVFALPEFIKKIPHALRPRYIMEMMGQGNVVGTNDFTAFESLFVKELMEACEMQLYRHMGQNFPQWVQLVERALLGTNVMKYKQFTAYVDACRMSGEMCTSLGNGFSNLMILLFICHKSGSDWRNVRGVIEGDDSLFNLPEKFDSSYYSKLGLRAKLETFDCVSEGSFCGLVFDVVDQVNVADPRKVLASVGWGPMKYHHSSDNTKESLLRAKGMSMAHQYPGCPIIDVLAHRILYLTRSKNVKYDKKDWYHVEDMKQAIAKSRDLILKGPTPPLPRTRLLVERKFGISVDEQIRLEEEISKWNFGEHTESMTLMAVVPKSWLIFADKYVWPIDKKGKMPYLHEVPDTFGHFLFLTSQYDTWDKIVVGKRSEVR